MWIASIFEVDIYLNCYVDTCFRVSWSISPSLEKMTIFFIIIKNLLFFSLHLERISFAVFKSCNLPSIIFQINCIFSQVQNLCMMTWLMCSTGGNFFVICFVIIVHWLASSGVRVRGNHAILMIVQLNANILSLNNIGKDYTLMTQAASKMQWNINTSQLCKIFHFTPKNCIIITLP